MIQAVIDKAPTGYSLTKTWKRIPMIASKATMIATIVLNSVLK